MTIPGPIPVRQLLPEPFRSGDVAVVQPPPPIVIDPFFPEPFFVDPLRPLGEFGVRQQDPFADLGGFGAAGQRAGETARRAGVGSFVGTQPEAQGRFARILAAIRGIGELFFPVGTRLPGIRTGLPGPVVVPGRPPISQPEAVFIPGLPFPGDLPPLPGSIFGGPLGEGEIVIPPGGRIPDGEPEVVIAEEPDGRFPPIIPFPPFPGGGGDGMAELSDIVLASVRAAGQIFGEPTGTFGNFGGVPQGFQQAAGFFLGDQPGPNGACPPAAPRMPGSILAPDPCHPKNPTVYLKAGKVSTGLYPQILKQQTKKARKMAAIVRKGSPRKKRK